ncbi:MAG: hypothetical protein E5299_01660 [Burkholderia gladioli]|nr:MAG: hypothetical protein E5299_01660 [Burkholderia gladioli]
MFTKIIVNNELSNTIISIISVFEKIIFYLRVAVLGSTPKLMVYRVANHLGVAM